MLFPQISSPVVYESAAAAASTDLLVRLLTESLCETAYLADVAGLQYEVGRAACLSVHYTLTYVLPVLSVHLTLTYVASHNEQ